MGQGFGAFGKMPALGDFFHLNAPQGFVRAWDDWLQGAMMSAAQSGGDAWDDQYMSAPIWRFTLPPGLAGAAKVLGVLMPSVDRVGRRFPLALMTAIEGDGPAVYDHLTSDGVFDRLEDVALSALDDGMDRDRLAAQLQDIPLPQASYAAMQRTGKALVMRQTSPAGIAPEMAAGLMGATGMQQPTLWSTLLDGTRRAMICDGFPDAHQARALFDLTAPLWAEARPSL